MPATSATAAPTTRSDIAEHTDSAAAVGSAAESTPRPVRRIVVGVAGTAVVLAGIVMLVVPGPGWLAIFAGLAIWRREFAWAERLHRWLAARVKTTAGRMRPRSRRQQVVIWSGVAVTVAIVAGVALTVGIPVPDAVSDMAAGALDVIRR